MLEALVAADSVTYAAVLNGGAEYGNPRPGMIVAPIGDRYLAMQFTGSGELWPRLLSVMGRPELGRDPRFDTSEKRRTNWRELRPIVESWLATFASVEEARKVLSEARIPCAPVLKPAEVIAEPHMAERQFFPDVPHPGRGAVRVTASPYHIDGQPVHPRGPAAYRVGEHTRAVLGDLLGCPRASLSSRERSSTPQLAGSRPPAGQACSGGLDTAGRWLSFLVLLAPGRESCWCPAVPISRARPHRRKAVPS
jgi:crotonobetainyl-CoA:carnitine CoA-transferase CaiB-like acyl-CoA transferase